MHALLTQTCKHMQLYERRHELYFSQSLLEQRSHTAETASRTTGGTGRQHFERSLCSKFFSNASNCIRQQARKLAIACTARDASSAATLADTYDSCSTVASLLHHVVGLSNTIP
jgi:hypothetical protein